MYRNAVEILTIGDEILGGQIVNTNASWLAGRLTALGFPVRWMTTCSDDPADIEAALRQAGARARLVLATGGLGPTDDDRTVAVVAAVCGAGLARDPGALAKLAARYAAANATPTPNNLKQAEVPAGSTVLTNSVGLAPGFALDLPGGARGFFFPGVPRELKAIFAEEVGPALAAFQAGGAARVARTFHVIGLRESVLDHKLQGLTAGLDGVTVHYRTAFPENHVTIYVDRPAAAAAAAVLDGLDGAVRARLGRHVYGVDDDTFPAALGRRLRARGATLALAESCTGGLIGHLVTEVTGASDYLLLGAVTYSNAAKQQVLGVNAATLGAHGAVSEPTVREMAAGARRLAGATFAVAVSGIAGPTGGTPEKPVGTVHVAVAGPDGTRARHFLFPFPRDMVKLAAAYAALEMVYRAADGEAEDQ
ncbi:MAG TPA: CinA family nicotinamide mononucleotide deamidase-related protein [Polyangia bacterium]